MKFVIYTADCVGDKYNAEYPYRQEIESAEDLIKAAAFDHVCAEYKNDHRENENYISSDCLFMDVDNDGTENPEEWIYPDSLPDEFDSLSYVVTYSRHNQKVKHKGEPGKERGPRPRFHVYFKIRSLKDFKKYAEIKKSILNRWPFFDPNSADAARFVYGCKTSVPVWHEGSSTIDKLLEESRSSVKDPAGPAAADYDDLEDLAKNSSYKAPEEMPAGSRTISLVQLAGALSAKGLSPEAIRAALQVENETKCSPPLTEKELEREVFPAIGRFTAADEKKRAPDDGLSQFHKWNKDHTRALDIIDAYIADHIIENNTIIAISGEPYIYDGGVYLVDPGGLRIRALIKTHIYKELQTSQRIDRVYRLLIMDARIQHSANDLNLHPAEWINCRNGMLDLKTGTLKDHSPDYYSLNQIPYEYDPGYKVPPDCITNAFLRARISDPEDRQMFLEFVGCCLTAYTGFQKFMIIHGEGGIGKSVLLDMVCRVVGRENLIAKSMQSLSGRFGTYCLYGKLLDCCADLSSESMTDTGPLKMIIGGDEVPAEIKGGPSFSFRPYVKLLFSANRVPGTKDEQTNAFYRRLLILSLNGKCEQFTDLPKRLEDDAKNFFYMALNAAAEAFRRGFLFESPRSRTEIMDLYERTDSVKAFLNHCVVEEKGSREKTTDLYDSYEAFCMDQDRGTLSRRAFRANVKEKGHAVVMINGYEYFKGIRIIKNRPNGE